MPIRPVPNISVSPLTGLFSGISDFFNPIIQSQQVLQQKKAQEIENQLRQREIADKQERSDLQLEGLRAFGFLGPDGRPSSDLLRKSLEKEPDYTGIAEEDKPTHYINWSLNTKEGQAKRFAGSILGLPDTLQHAATIAHIQATKKQQKSIDESRQQEKELEKDRSAINLLHIYASMPYDVRNAMKGILEKELEKKGFDSSSLDYESGRINTKKFYKASGLLTSEQLDTIGENETMSADAIPVITNQQINTKHFDLEKAKFDYNTFESFKKLQLLIKDEKFKRIIQNADLSLQMQQAANNFIKSMTSGGKAAYPVLASIAELYNSNIDLINEIKSTKDEDVTPQLESQVKALMSETAKRLGINVQTPEEQQIPGTSVSGEFGINQPQGNQSDNVFNSPIKKPSKIFNKLPIGTELLNSLPEKGIQQQELESNELQASRLRQDLEQKKILFPLQQRQLQLDNERTGLNISLLQKQISSSITDDNKKDLNKYQDELGKTGDKAWSSLLGYATTTYHQKELGLPPETVKKLIPDSIILAEVSSYITGELAKRLKINSSTSLKEKEVIITKLPDIVNDIILSTPEDTSLLTWWNQKRKKLDKNSPEAKVDQTVAQLLKRAQAARDKIKKGLLPDSVIKIGDGGGSGVLKPATPQPSSSGYNSGAFKPNKTRE